MSQTHFRSILIRALVSLALVAAVFSLLGFDVPYTQESTLEFKENQPQVPSLGTAAGYPGTERLKLQGWGHLPSSAVIDRTAGYVYFGSGYVISILENV